MWTDNASKIDMLFYEPYAEIIADTALNVENEDPLTIGVFGLWGAGKSTLLNLIEDKVETEKGILCVTINAWMFEGYEDAKTAMMEALLEGLCEEDISTDLKEKFRKLCKRVDLFKVGTKVVSNAAPLIASIVAGNPLPFVLSIPKEAEEIGKTVKKVSESLQSVKNDYLKDVSDDDSDSMVSNIRKFRKEFEEAISDKNIKRVVILVDDLDRCQPERIIETLEAIKLFLAVRKTTFVIAADENVIQYAIKKKYPVIDGQGDFELDKEYIEKIIQLPILIPELSLKDVQNYLLLLSYQKYLSDESFSKLIISLKNKRMMTASKPISISQINELMKESNIAVANQDEAFENVKIISDIAPVVASSLKGNPRQAKRFLNTFITKRRLSELYYGKDIDLKILAKLLVLHKLDPELFVTLNEWNKSFDGEIKEFREMLEASDSDENYKKWKTSKMKRWVECEPVELDKYCLDKYFYLTREALSNSSEDRAILSDKVKELLERVNSFTSGQEKQFVLDVKKCDSDEMNELMPQLERLIMNGKISPVLYQALYVEMEAYRKNIIDALKKRNTPIEMPEVPALSAMYSIDSDSITELVEYLTEKKLIKATIAKRIVK